MSDHDSELSRALGAYAAKTSRDALDSAKVRRRVLADVIAPRRRAPRKLSFVLALAATFAASAAFAASQPAVRQALRESWHTLLGAAPRAKPLAPPAGHGVAKAPVPSASPAVAPPAEPSPVSLSELPLLPEARPAVSAAPAPDASASPAAPGTEPTADPAFNAEVESYRQAHRLHFSGAAPVAALAAWDEYLDEYPAGTFSADARFNRALCLVRLGRRAEARRALTPFAEAPIGSYRQQEAASLLLSFGGASAK